MNRFFDGPGLQFATHAARRRLAQGLPENRIVWMNAADPASPCGLGLLDGLPRRVWSSHLVWHGRMLVLVSEARGRRLQIHVTPDHPCLPDYLQPLKVMLTRSADPKRQIRVEEINGERASDSPYRETLRALFAATGDRDALHLARRF